MKRKLIISLSLALCMASIPNLAFAYTENRVSKVVTVQKNTEFTESMAPKLVIEASDDHKESFSFELIVENCIWQDTDVFSLPEGISLTKITDTSMVVNIDIDKFDATKKNIEIPMLVTDTNGAVSVTVDGSNSTVSSGTYTFAQAGSAKTKIDVSNAVEIGRTGTMGTLTFTDYSVESVRPNDKFKIQLSNDFSFIKEGNITGTGKYAKNVQFTIDKEDPTVGYITVMSATKNDIGTIVLSGVQIKASENSTYGDVSVTISQYGQSVSLDVAEYEKIYKDITITDISNATSKPKIEGKCHLNKYLQISIDGKLLGTVKSDNKGTWSYTANTDIKSGKHTVKAQYYDEKLEEVYEYVTKDYETAYSDNKIVFTIGSDRYVMNGRKYKIDAPAYVDKNNRTMLPVRAFSNALGILDENIEWDDRDRVVTITRQDDTTVRIPVNSRTIYIAGSAKTIDTQSVIVNDRIYLPLRAVSNALGISDDNIKWNQDEKTITITK